MHTAKNSSLLRKTDLHGLIALAHPPVHIHQLGVPGGVHRCGVCGACIRIISYVDMKNKRRERK